jgi:hypothetical protein
MITENTIKTANSIRQRKWYNNTRNRILIHYGGNPPQCACCGETTTEFLCIDHIAGGGRKHKKEVGGMSGFYNWMLSNKFPEGFQILCHNCNMAKGFYGSCPHKRKGIKKLEGYIIDKV